MNYRIKEEDGVFYLQKRGWFRWYYVRTSLPIAAPITVRVAFNNYEEAISHLKLLSRPELKTIIKYHYVGNDGYVFTEDFDRSTHTNKLGCVL